MSPSFFSGNIANMIPEGPLNKMVPPTEVRGGGGGGGGVARGPPLADGLSLFCEFFRECAPLLTSLFCECYHECGPLLTSLFCVLSWICHSVNLNILWVVSWVCPSVNLTMLWVVSWVCPSVNLTILGLLSWVCPLFPAERSRPYLITHDSNDSTDYINAVYVDVSRTYCQLTHCSLVTPYGVMKLDQHWSTLTNMPDGTKPLSEPMLIYHQWGPVIFISGQFHKKYPSH